MAATETYVRNQLYQIPLKDLQPDPDQPRKFFDDAALEELTASIAQHGVLEPIIFRRDQETQVLYVVAGERRVAAARKAGLTEIPAIFNDSQNHAEISLVENLLRQDLTPVEEAEALGRLSERHSYKQEDLAQVIGKSQASVSEILSINNLPQSIRDECRSDPSVPKRTLVEIAKAKQERGMFSLYNKYRQKEAAQQQKADGQTTVTKKSAGTAIMEAANNLSTRIAKSDMTTWKEDERTGLQTAVTDISSALEKQMAAVAAAQVAVTKKKKKVLA
ncbi:MAG: ParB/RepB/Spo0J family partition protein [Syntrophales bacterium]|nr:ParB/RepB/Spo0J family partition protein [Syntrophales bacterium]